MENILFYPTIMFVAGCIMIMVLKWKYLKTVESINAEYGKENVAKIPPRWDFNVNVAFNWNFFGTILVFVLVGLYNQIDIQREFNRTEYVQDLTEQIMTCRQDVRREVLLELKNLNQ